VLCSGMINVWLHCIMIEECFKSARTCHTLHSLSYEISILRSFCCYKWQSQFIACLSAHDSDYYIFFENLFILCLNPEKCWNFSLCCFVDISWFLFLPWWILYLFLPSCLYHACATWSCTSYWLFVVHQVLLFPRE